MCPDRLTHRRNQGRPYLPEERPKQTDRPLTGSEHHKSGKRQLRLAERHHRRFQFEPTVPAEGGLFDLLRLRLGKQVEVVERDEQRGPRCNNAATETDW